MTSSNWMRQVGGESTYGDTVTLANAYELRDQLGALAEEARQRREAATNELVAHATATLGEAQRTIDSQREQTFREIADQGPEFVAQIKSRAPWAAPRIDDYVRRSGIGTVAGPAPVSPTFNDPGGVGDDPDAIAAPLAPLREDAPQAPPANQPSESPFSTLGRTLGAMADAGAAEGANPVQRFAAGATRGLGNMLTNMGGSADEARRSMSEGDLPGAAGNILAGAMQGVSPGAIGHAALMEVGAPEWAANAAGLAGDLAVPARGIEEGVGLAVRGARAAVPVVREAVEQAGGVVPFLERGEARLPGAADEAPKAAAPAPTEPLKLSPAGEAERAKLIRANVDLGYPEDAATEMVDSFIARLREKHAIPDDYVAGVDDLRKAAAEALTPPAAASTTPAATKSPPTGLGKALDVANRVRYSGMLSNPVGGLADIISNAFQIPVQYNRVLQAAVMEGIGERLGKIAPHERSAVLGEIQAMNAGLTSGVLQGAKEALGLLVQGGTPVRAEQAQGLVRGPIGLLLEGGQRLRIAADALNQHLGEAMATNALAVREAHREGLRYGSREFATRAAELAAAIKTRLAAGDVEQAGVLPTKGLDDAAKVDQLAAEVQAWAKRNIFQAELGTTAKALDESRAAPLMRFLVPFLKTQLSIGSQAATMLPGLGHAGAAADLWRAGADAGGKLAGPYATAGNRLTTSASAAVLPASQRAADANLGLMIAATGGALVASGLMVGGPPRDQRLRDAWYDAGNRPYSLKVGDRQIPIERLVGPLAIPLLFGASLMDGYLANGEEVDHKMLAEFANGVQAEWFDAAGLRAFHSLLSNARGGLFTRAAEREAARTVSSFLPSGALIRAIANATDDVQRAPRTLLEFVAEGLPVAREYLPAQTDELKRPVRKPTGQRGVAAFSPIQVNRATDAATPLDREITAAKRAALADLGRDPSYKKMSAKEQAAARTRVVSAVSRRYTDRRAAAVTASLAGPDRPVPAIVRGLRGS